MKTGFHYIKNSPSRPPTEESSNEIKKYFFDAAAFFRRGAPLDQMKAVIYFDHGERLRLKLLLYSSP